jgi:rhodanese-related sulfurtransferase
MNISIKNRMKSIMLFVILLLPIQAIAQTGQFIVPSDLIARKVIKVDVKARISVNRVQQALKKGRVIFVDTRSPADFEKLRIAGSINIPLFLIKTKEFLKDKFVVLVNEGYAFSQLEKECARLRSSGFTQVFILDGGLNGWQQAGLELAGDPFAAKELVNVSAQTFFMERHFENWTVIDVVPENLASARFLPEAAKISFSGKDDFPALLQKHLGQPRSDILYLTMIIDEQGENYAALKRLLDKAGINNVYYLEGGLAGYKTFLHRQSLMRQPQKLQSGVKECSTCP